MTATLEPTQPKTVLRAALADVFDRYEWDTQATADSAYSLYAFKAFGDVEVVQIANATARGVEVLPMRIDPNDMDILDADEALQLARELEAAAQFIKTASADGDE